MGLRNRSGAPQQDSQFQQPMNYSSPSGGEQSNVLAILGLVFAFVFSPAGVVLSLLGLKKSKQVGKGRGLALAGLIISIVSIVLSIVFAVVTLVAAKSAIDDINDSGVDISVTDTVDGIPEPITDGLLPLPEGAPTYDPIVVGTTPTSPAALFELVVGEGGDDGGYFDEGVYRSEDYLFVDGSRVTEITNNENLEIVYYRGRINADNTTNNDWNLIYGVNVGPDGRINDVKFAPEGSTPVSETPSEPVVPDAGSTEPIVTDNSVILSDGSTAHVTGLTGWKTTETPGYYTNADNTVGVVLETHSTGGGALPSSNYQNWATYIDSVINTYAKSAGLGKQTFNEFHNDSGMITDDINEYNFSVLTFGPSKMTVESTMVVKVSERTAIMATVALLNESGRADYEQVRSTIVDFTNK